MNKTSERQTEPVARESANLVAERTRQLQALFPDAVSEGVLKTFKVTQGHFAELFDNEPYRYEVYESRNLNRLKSYAEDEGVRSSLELP